MLQEIKSQFSNKKRPATFFGKQRPKPDKSWIKPMLLGGAAITLLVLEKKRPLRTEVESKMRHDTRNLAISTLSALAINLTEKPITSRLTRVVEEKNWGLLRIISMPSWLRTVLSVMLLDYTLYLWHVLTHKWSFLWRFHEVHHQDVDLTASTALRFHFAEMGMSAFWRGGQVLLLGVSRKSLELWQTLTLFEIMFHHANIKLPEKLEKYLSRIIVTPRMHAIHHSTVKEETASNWSSGLTVWDYLHGTLRLDVPQESIEIGVPGYGDDEDVKFKNLMLKPFRAQKESWEPEEPARLNRSKANEHSDLALH